ncbi:hypothetical protein AN0935.2 [Aspergillus nidulans FGSC A4]|nr:hypothetical protein AN0935.2 [Aspergillus nidulans FGSC A4]|eukprot:XP_658539.1 hypothetical protein AN0935.2 [Aspergillus nidulans FGSC A4]
MSRLAITNLLGASVLKYDRFAHEITTGLFKAIVDNQLFAMGVFDGFMLLAAPLTALCAEIGNQCKRTAGDSQIYTWQKGLYSFLLKPTLSRHASNMLRSLTEKQSSRYMDGRWIKVHVLPLQWKFG